MTTKTIANVLAVLMFGAVSLGALGPSMAADKVPETAAEHQAAADEFKTKAQGHRAEAGMHQKMGEMYQTQIKGPSNQKPNPWLINMVKHCKKMSAKATELAVMEEKAAEFHAQQAK